MSQKLLLFSGWLSFAIGIVGVFLPILPTTPFIVLAAFCFSKSSRKLHKWLRNHSYFGPPLRDWEEKKVISIKAKWTSTVLLAISTISTWIQPQIPLWAKICMASVIAAVLVFIWTRNSDRGPTL